MRASSLCMVFGLVLLMAWTSEAQHQKHVDILCLSGDLDGPADGLDFLRLKGWCDSPKCILAIHPSRPLPKPMPANDSQSRPC
uniref:Chemokine ligand-like protein n=1 Tax=Ctenopharyngodon idella TaxID=7959 RepID=A0A345D742_CTEID|nr:chemokine ligand-like protein [Ctenopharyngodon idella]